MAHTTVHIEIHRVSSEPVGNTLTCRCMGPCNHAKPQTKREDVEVVNLTARVDGVTDAALDQAINKATSHLECERPVTDNKFRGGLNE